MELPNIEHKIADPASGVIFNVVAYRQLSRPEVVQAVHTFAASNRKLVSTSRGETLMVIYPLGSEP